MGMAEYEVTDQQGQSFIVTAPDDAPEEEVRAFARQHLSPPSSSPSGVLGTVANVAAGLAPVGAAERVGKALAPSALPIAGSIALPAAATAVAGPANAPFIPIERGVGSGLGEAANQVFGITEPSMKQIAIATGLPVVLEYAANLVRTLPHAVGPGTLNTLAPKEAADKIAGMRGAQQVDDLFAQAGAEGGTVPVTKTKALMISVLENKNISSAEKKAFRKVLNDSGLSEFLSEDVRGLNPARLQRVLNATGELVPSATGYEGGHLKRLFGALSDDLDTAASTTGTGAPTLKLARDVYKREKVLDAIDEQIQSSFKINRGQGAQGQFNANKIINTLKDTSEGTGKFFAQAFSKSEQTDLIEFFEFLNKIPGLGAPAGATRGSEALLKNVGRTVGTSTIGGGVGFALGGPTGAAVGTAIGAAIPPSIETIKLMNMTWQMQGGRDLLKGLMLNSDGAITPQVIGTMGAFLSGQMAQAPSREDLGVPSTSMRATPNEQ